MIGAVLMIIIVSAILHLSISKLGEKYPAIVYFVENFSGTILIICVMMWGAQADSTDRHKFSMTMAYAAIYFFFVFTSKLSGRSLYSHIPPKKNKIPLKIDILSFIGALISVRVANSLLGDILDPGEHPVLFLAVLIPLYYVITHSWMSKINKPPKAQSTQ